MVGYDNIFGSSYESTSYDDTPETQGNPIAVTALNFPSAFTAGLSTGGGTITPATALIGVIGLLLILKLIGDSKLSAIERAHIHIGPYNLFVLAVASILSLVGAKIIFNKFQVPGITDLVNAA